MRELAVRLKHGETLRQIFPSGLSFTPIGWPQVSRDSAASKDGCSNVGPDELDAITLLQQAGISYAGKLTTDIESAELTSQLLKLGIQPGLSATEFRANDPDHLRLLTRMGIHVHFAKNGQIELTQHRDDVSPSRSFFL
ncbi:unnamed protein product [Protopolystoma xenopodis]|uniref:Uncharacterized protein n=1 Tax=Protopolystoma xenopodis TaxID=117903 RepID=A0A3S5AAG0_9PLAT|nr:unnamed protein product [Protopolystoma xenopodis]